MWSNLYSSVSNKLRFVSIETNDANLATKIDDWFAVDAAAAAAAE